MLRSQCHAHDMRTQIVAHGMSGTQIVTHDMSGTQIVTYYVEYNFIHLSDLALIRGGFYVGAIEEFRLEIFLFGNFNRFYISHGYLGEKRRRIKCYGSECLVHPVKLVCIGRVHLQ